MQKWEYLHFSSTNQEVNHINYGKVKPLNLNQYLAQIGQDGWEIFSVIEIQNIGLTRFYAKRPIEK